ncbi:hypothetical protein [Streptomyces sp. NPDC000880]
MTTQNASEETSETQARKKLSITLSPDVARRAKLAGGKNFSGFVEQALEEKLLHDGMLEYARLRALDSADDLFEAAESDIEAAA